MSRGHIEFLRFDDLPRLAWQPQGLLSGLRASSLSRDSQSGAETLLVECRPLWRWSDSVAWCHDVELLVLEGDLSLGEQSIGAGQYVFWPAGHECHGLASHAGARVLWMAGDDRGPTPLSTGDWRVIDTHALPWSVSPSFEGRSSDEAGPGLGVRILREDAETGAYTLMTRHAPGWFDTRLEAHDTWEELILLEGDYLMGETGGIVAGTYIFRPGDRPHGPQATRTGAVWFCRGEKRIDFQFTTASWAEGQVAKYLTGLPVGESYWSI